MSVKGAPPFLNEHLGKYTDMIPTAARAVVLRTVCGKLSTSFKKKES